MPGVEEVEGAVHVDDAGRVARADLGGSGSQRLSGRSPVEAELMNNSQTSKCVLIIYTEREF